MKGHKLLFENHSIVIYIQDTPQTVKLCIQ